MKVAVISQGQTSGKTCFISLLAGIFSRSQNKNVAILSTGDVEENFEIVEVKDRNKSLRSIHVFEALLSSDAIETRELFDYGYRVGQENVFLYDLMGSAMDESQLKDLFMQTLERVPADLTLVEIKGSIKEEFNREILKKCDAILYLFNVSKVSIRLVQDYVKNEDADLTRKTGYICSMYDRNALGESKLSKLLGMNARNIMLFPYNSVVQKESLDGTLDSIVYYIMKGQNEVIGLRSKFLEIMQYLFDIPGKYRYIREVNEWFR